MSNPTSAAKGRRPSISGPPSGATRLRRNSATMLTLRFSPASPFVRKVRIGAALAGLPREIEIVAAETTDPAEVLRRQNPLGKIPALILEDGTVLYDSRVILEYLDHRAGGGRILPRDPGARLEALRPQALRDGNMGARTLPIYHETLAGQ